MSAEDPVSAVVAEAQMRSSERRMRGLSLRLILLISLVAIVITTLVLVSFSVLGLLREAVERERLSTARLLAVQAASDASVLDSWAETGLIAGWWLSDGGIVQRRGAIDDEAAEGLIREAASAEAPVARVVPSGDGRLALAAAPAREGQVIVVGLSMQRLDQQLASVQVLILLYLLLVGLLMLVFGYWLLTRSVVRPVHRLVRATDRVAEGDLDTAIAVVGGGELGQLSESFNAMVTAMRLAREDQESSYRALEVAKDSLVRSEKLASVGRLAAGVAHEIGNPLASILAYLELLEEPDNTEEETATYLAEVQRSTKRIHGIIRELLDYSRTPTADVELADPTLAIKQALRLVEPQPGFRDVELVLELAEDVPEISIDEARLVQILVNLLLNAADAVGGSGKITVAVVCDAHMVRIRVGDNGPGIAPEHQPHIFEPFFTTKSPGEGTGLGLAICERLAEMLHAELRLLGPEEWSEGACFELSLPRSNEDNAEPARATEAADVR